MRKFINQTSSCQDFTNPFEPPTDVTAYLIPTNSVKVVNVTSQFMASVIFCIISLTQQGEPIVAEKKLCILLLVPLHYIQITHVFWLGWFKKHI